MQRGCCVLKTVARELQGALGDCPVRASCQVLQSPMGLDPLCSLLSRAFANALRYCYQDTKYFPNILTCRQGSAFLHASSFETAQPKWRAKNWASASGSVWCAWGVYTLTVCTHSEAGAQCQVSPSVTLLCDLDSISH